jgi:hypothetical protein
VGQGVEHLLNIFWSAQEPMPIGSDINLSNIQYQAAKSLTHKSPITLQKINDADLTGPGWACCLEGNLIGYVPSASSQLINSALGGRSNSQNVDSGVRVRSIRRERDSQQVIGIEVWCNTTSLFLLVGLASLTLPEHVHEDC